MNSDPMELFKLFRFKIGIVSAEPTSHVDRALPEFALTPLPISSLDGELIVGIMSGMGSIEIHQYVRLALTDISRVGNVMARTAQLRLGVISGFKKWMPGEI